MNPNKFNADELKYLENLVYHAKDRSIVGDNAYTKIRILMQEELDWKLAKEVEFKWVGPDQYTMDTLHLAPYGTIITFTYNACSNVRVQCFTPPTTLLKMFKRDSYNYTSTASEPVVMAIKINSKTWELLNNKIIPNELFPFYGNMANLDTLTEVAFLDYGYRNPNQG